MKKKKKKLIIKDMEIIKSIRRFWTINPATKRFKDRTKYDRKKPKIDQDMT